MEEKIKQRIIQIEEELNTCEAVASGRGGKALMATIGAAILMVRIEELKLILNMFATESKS